MEGLRIEVSYSGTYINPAARGSYYTGKSGARKHGMSALMIALK